MYTQPSYHVYYFKQSETGKTFANAFQIFYLLQH